MLLSAPLLSQAKGIKSPIAPLAVAPDQSLAARGQVQINPFTDSSGQASGFVAALERQIIANLASVGLLAAAQRRAAELDPPDLPVTQKRSAEPRVQISGSVAVFSADIFIVSLIITDRRQGLQISRYETRAQRENGSRVANRLSDQIYFYMTGLPGHFDTRIAFIEAQASGDRLALMLSDGSEQQTIMQSKAQLSSPRYRLNPAQLLFVAQQNHLRAIAEQGDRSTAVLQIEGLVGDVELAPGGRYLVFSRDVKGNEDLYLHSLSNGQERRLTWHPGRDRAPQFAPDGQSLLFVSDRSGTLQIHRLLLAESKVERLSYAGGRYIAPVHSPSEPWVAFTKQVGAKQYLGLLNPDTGREQLLVTAQELSRPSWSPNGRMLVYHKRSLQSSETEIWTYNLILMREQRLGEGTLPVWLPPSQR
jgi:TolB protein